MPKTILDRGSWNWANWGFPARHGGTPLSLDGFSKGQSHLEMDENWGSPYDSGNHQLAMPQSQWDAKKGPPVARSFPEGRYGRTSVATETVLVSLPICLRLSDFFRHLPYWRCHRLQFRVSPIFGQTYFSMVKSIESAKSKLLMVDFFKSSASPLKVTPPKFHG